MVCAEREHELTITKHILNRSGSLCNPSSALRKLQINAKSVAKNRKFQMLRTEIKRFYRGLDLQIFKLARADSSLLSLQRVDICFKYKKDYCYGKSELYRGDPLW